LKHHNLVHACLHDNFTMHKFWKSSCETKTLGCWYGGRLKN
jgi:hypothetical protein